jgi:hypothetical protein
MSDENVGLDEKTIVDGPSGRGIGKGGQGGTQGDGGDVPPEDFMRLAKMLARIKSTLGNLINLDLGILDSDLRREFVSNWKRAASILDGAIEILRFEAVREKLQLPTRSRLRGQLQRAGMTGGMLRMKETSLVFYLNSVDNIISQPLTGKETVFEKAIGKLLTWTKPAFKVMNSILGSLLKAFPGMEVVKELKEHVEAGYEIAGAIREERE